MTKTNLKIRFGSPRDLGIDLGTANTLVYTRGRGIVLREPSVVAVNLNTNSILAVGSEAYAMIGRTPAYITAIRPMKQGAIADFETTRRMLAHFIRKVVGRSPLKKIRVVISVPFNTTQVEKRAVFEAAKQAGAREVFLVEEPLAAAIGAGLVVEEPEGHMIVNIGGGTTEVATIALGGVVKGLSIRSAGDRFDEDIQSYLRKEYRLDIGEKSAEALKIQQGSAWPMQTEENIFVKGIDLRSGLPTSVEVGAEEIQAAISNTLENIIRGIKNVYEQTPPQLASDIIERGIVLTGGGALLNDMDRLIANEMRLPVQVAEKPLECVVRGTGKIIQEVNSLTRLALYHA